MAKEEKPELRDLTRELRDLPWDEVKEMAIQLEMKLRELLKIERMYSQESERLSRAMHAWLEANEAATWKNIVDALKSIKNNSLAEDLRKRYPHLFNSY